MCIRDRFYACPKENKRPCIIDPAPYEMGGKTVMMSSFNVPIMVGDQFRGAVGADLSLAFIQDLLKRADQQLYDGAGEMALIASNGRLVAYTRDDSKLGEPAGSVLDGNEVDNLKNLTVDQPLYDIDAEHGHIELFLPFTIADSGVRWTLMLQIPQAAVFGELQQLQGELSDQRQQDILGMSLAHGGHLTHGAKVSSSGKLYNAVQYGLDTATGLIDYDEVERLAVEHKPKMIVAGFSAYSKTLDFPRFRASAYLFVDMAHVAGLVAAGVYPNPVPFADVVTTTTHKTLRGPRGGLILARANEEIEKKLNSAVFPGAQGGPLMHVIAAKAVCFKEALEPGFKDYQAQVIRNAKAMAEVFIGRGYDVVSGGTDNHLMLISLVRQGLTGKEADAALGRVGITVNKNAVPNDPQSPFVTSGIRIGTPAITTRGLQEAQSRELAGWICDILDHLGDADVEAKVATQVAGLCADFPVYR